MRNVETVSLAARHVINVRITVASFTTIVSVPGKYGRRVDGEGVDGLGVAQHDENESFETVDLMAEATCGVLSP